VPHYTLIADSLVVHHDSYESAVEDMLNRDDSPCHVFGSPGNLLLTTGEPEEIAAAERVVPGTIAVDERVVAEEPNRRDDVTSIALGCEREDCGVASFYDDEERARTAGWTFSEEGWFCPACAADAAFERELAQSLAKRRADDLAEEEVDRDERRREKR
jgi:hypothetical protein